MAPEEKLQKTLVRLVLITPIIIVVGMTIYSELAWKGYWFFNQPNQPIDFPHTLHAGVNGIECSYCHRGAENGYGAGVPSVTDCWQCHQGLVGDSQNGGKIIDRPGVQQLKQFVDDRREITWFKYYDMPEHVKFAHKAHINAKIECTECHGDVANQAVIQMKQKPTMGWCVSCHRANNAPQDCTTCHR